MRHGDGGNCALGDVFSDAVKRAELQPDQNGEVLTFHDLGC
jgi:hypothetical protein